MRRPQLIGLVHSFTANIEQYNMTVTIHSIYIDGDSHGDEFYFINTNFFINFIFIR